MKAFISSQSNQYLNLDARNIATRVELALNIVDKSAPDSWRVTYENHQVDHFITHLRRKALKQTADLYFKISCANEDLRFAKSCSAHSRQAFDGILFVAGNHTMREMRAAETELVKPDLLRLSIIPSDYWTLDPRVKADKGSKIGFRFVIQDKRDNVFFSHDPIISVPDWD
ncbi:hypothetical protein [Bowmanella denitrificans]|uniref:hypothetical protein n=1 Tax=Bowmanella denitrificans TaxID=366582 RepID=UPI000C99C416|nr:hypothetical protein [Bowmanella denitrificans]